ncbi:MAG TPA: hypothetical protein VKT18_10010, partial [Acidimicrobiales bacterium]|nr:hypothetical protein [Acidimicrobiales bacterium]
MATVRFLLRGMRWRLGVSLLTVLTSAIAVGAALLGPLYLRTAGDSVVRTTVASASIADRGATLSAAVGQVVSLGAVVKAERLVEDAGGVHRFYGAPITSALSGVSVVAARVGLVRTQLLARTGICAVLRFREGRCDLRFGDIAVSDRSARELDASVGSVVEASVQGRSRPLALKVTGIYAVPSFQSPYWWGNAAGDFPFGHTTTGQMPLPELDSFVASPVTALAVPPQDGPTVIGQVPLRTATVGLGDEASFR